LDGLAYGQEKQPGPYLLRKLGVAGKIREITRVFEFVIELAIRPRRYSKHGLYKFRLNQLFDNPYLRVEKLNYLKDIEGIVSVPKLFFSTQVAARLRRQQPVRIDLRGFDILLTSCPLNIKPERIPTFVQTVHDLIPLEFTRTHDDALMFSNRLQACLQAKRLFVSQSSATKFNKHINQLKVSSDIESRQSVIIQPPSLSFPSWLTADPERVSDMKPVSYLLRDDDPNRRLRPLRYFLFNSSVEARKNLLFLTQAYSESDLSSQGIQLCVTGKLKDDDYSEAVKKIVQHEPGILLTGYVDESTKLDLYLNALGLVSPSLVEGFGIPVLDGACLGMPTIASDCESHLEIQALQDFKDSVITLDTLKTRNWAAAMQAVAGLNNNLWENAAQERQRRIGRYEKLRSGFYDQLQADLEEILN
jgi:glycosyltransferase involved in cell wall biosynthesis